MFETPTPHDRIRVILGDPDPIARRALRQGLESADGFTVVAATADGTEAAELTVHYRPEVTLLAARLAGDAVAVCARILDRAPDARVLLLASEHDSEQEMRALRVGASGLVTKQSGIDSIVAATRAVARGELAVSPDATRMLVERLRLLPESGIGLRPVHSALSQREWEVLDLLTAGCSTREIAGTLFLSPDTVLSHVKSILRKLGVHSRAEAVARGSELRWALPVAA